MIFLSTLLLSLFITVTLIPMLKALALRVNVVDVPNARKVHLKPIPKVGGIAMALGILFPVIVWTPLDDFGRALLAGAGVIAVCGMLDDVIELPCSSKFLGQIIAALIVIHYGGLEVRSLGTLLPPGAALPTAVAVPLTCLFVVGATNAFNLADGLDGLAGGLALLAFTCIGLMAYATRMPLVVFVSFAALGAIVGFLRFNTFPAVIFMGDTGSQLLGYLAACLSIYLTQSVLPLSPLLPLMLLGFPLLDTLIVMTERLARGVSPFKADQNHLHHKLMRLGLFHSEAVFAAYLHQALLIVLALVFRYQSDRVLLTIFAGYGAVVIAGSTLGARRGWQLPRYDLVDRVIKGRLRAWRESQVLIRLTFGAVKWLVPGLLVLTCLMLKAVPLYFALICLLLACGLMATALYQPAQLSGVLRLALYLSIPLIVYQGDLNTYDQLATFLRRSYNGLFGLLTLLVILTLKFTRRQKGFRATPMDFLILFVAVVVPYLPDPQLQNLHMGIVATRIVVLIFSYEVLIGELRGKVSGQSTVVAVVLGLVAIRAIAG